MGLLPEVDNRWELYKILGDPLRLRLVALGAEEELAIGELAELTGESQSNVSRHVSPLRRLGVLAERKEGTRVLLRLSDRASADPVIRDALEAGRALCADDRVLERVPEVVAARDAPARAFFASPVTPGDAGDFPSELPAYLSAAASLIPRRGLALDVGAGDGRLLEVLAPLFERVVAVEREPAQLALARERVQTRGFDNVQLLAGDLHDAAVVSAVSARGGADAVFASRVLHHAPRPQQAMRQLAALARVGGRVVVLDYAPHQDERMREQQADLWLGFAPEELADHARRAGLSEPDVRPIPMSFRGIGPDSHLRWQVFSALKRGDGVAAPNPSGEANHG